ncbi:PEP-CTERM sorting domain-containing protein [Paludibacterium yongneupense]|uniref:PEP-CTERM sorting domain-containing protein n=1 Tax=Paludibacterium yongneupense TaxID=400061 RepID=UPI00041E8C4F|nr:PEP-CTERM sorting domain-containing protein [Paludibacterium yongneupense]
MKTGTLFCALAASFAVGATAEAASSASAALDWSRFTITPLTGVGVLSGDTVSSSVTATVADSWWTSGTGLTDMEQRDAHIGTALSSAAASFDDITLASRSSTDGHYATAYADAYGSLSLAAHSSIRFSVPYLFALDLGGDSPDYPGNFAKTFAGLTVTVMGGSFPFPSYSTSVSGSIGSPTHSGSGWLDLVIDNTGASSETLAFTAIVSAETSNSVSPVPEPDAGALLALGLGMSGWLARRKTRRLRPA